jgi:hypothetical protein
VATITTLLNNITGLSFRQTLNENFVNLNADKAELTSLTALDNRITTNENDITTIEQDVTSLQSSVSTLQGVVNYFEFEEVEDTEVTSTTYQDIINVTYTPPVGIYKLDMSLLHTLSNNNATAFFRFSLDGGATWFEFSKKTLSPADINNSTVTKIINHLGGNFSIRIQARKESSGDTLTIRNLVTALQRKV